MLNYNRNLKKINILKKLSIHSLVYGISTALQPLGGFVLLPLYSQYFNKSEYGTYTLTITISTIFSTVFHLGINSAFTRSYFDYEKGEDRLKVFNTSLLILIVGFIAQIIIGLLLSDYFSKNILNNIDHKLILNLSIISSAISFINTGLFNNLRVKDFSLKYSLISALTLLVNVLTVLYLFEFWEQNIEAPIYAALVAHLVTLTVLIKVNKKDINLFKINRNEISILLRFGVPSIFAGFAIMIGEWGDSFIIDKYLTRSELGLYAFMFKIASIYNILIATPFSLVWNPFFLRLMKDPLISILCTSVASYYYYISILFILFIHLLSKDLLLFLNINQSYLVEIHIIPLLMFALFISSLQNIYSVGIFYSRKPEKLVTIYGIMGIVNVLFSICIAKTYGLIGIVYTFILIKLITSLWVFTVSRKYFSFKPFNTNTLIYISVFFIILSLSIYIEFVMINISLLLIVTSLIFLIKNIFIDLKKS